MLSIHLDIPVRAISANHIWKHAGSAHYRTRRYNAWERDVHTHIPHDARKRIKTDVELSIDYFLKGKRSVDVDNLLKGVLDALTHAGVWEDDAQVVCVHAHKHIGAESDNMRIIISSL